MSYSSFSRTLAFSFWLLAWPAWAGLVITSTQNLALVAEGGSLAAGNLAPAGTAFAQNEIGSAPHAIAKLNDGLQGNGNSWIAGAGGTFAGVSFGSKLVTVGRVAFGRDGTGNFADRALAVYTVQYTTVANPGAATPDASWTTLGTLDYQSSGGTNFSSLGLRHVFSFTPVQATGFRLKIAAASDLGSWVCVDEIELYAAPGLTLLEEAGVARTNNLAAGKTAFGTEVLSPPHAIASVNDGIYGNASSWLPATTDAAIGINLGATPVAVDKIAFSRDNAAVIGDRFAAMFDVQYTTVASPSESTPEGSWTTIGTLDYTTLPHTGKFSLPPQRHLWSFPTVSATGIRLRVRNAPAQVAVDELEIYDATSQERTPPVLTLPASVSVYAALPTSTSAVVTYAAAAAVDETDPAPVIAYSAASGSTFPVGTTTVTVTATDSAGNVTTKTFTVTVVLPTPQIVVEQPAPTALADGAGVVDFGVVSSGGSAVKTFTIRNTGNAPLTGLALTRDGAQAASFSTGALGATSLQPAESTTFTVTFAPGSEFMNQAVLRIASNMAGAANPFDVSLRGTLPCPVVTVQPPAVSSGEVGVAFSQSFTQSGGASPAVFIVTGGQLPSGIYLAADGTLAGRPLSAGTFAISVKALDLYGCTSAAASYSLTILGPKLRVEESGQELTVDKAVGAWGDPYLGKTTVPAGLNTGVVAVSAGTSYSLALRSDGTVVGWGSPSMASIPVGLSGVIAICAGDGHSLALKSDGTMVAWGGNYIGQCNIPSGLSGVVAIAAGGGVSVAVKEDGTVVAWGDNSFGQTNTTGLTGVVAAAASSSYAAYIKNDGSVVVRGIPPFNGSPFSGITNARAIAASYSQILVLKADGTLAIAGLHTQGGDYMTVPAGLDNVRAMGVGDDVAVALKNDGTLVRWGSTSNPAYTLSPVNPGFVRDVSLGYQHGVYLSGLVTASFTQALLTSGQTKTITLRNTGSAALTLGAISTTGNSADFAVSAPGATSIPPGGSTTFTVAFTPQAVSAGQRDIILSIPTNDREAAPFLLRFSAMAVDTRLASLGVSGVVLSPAFASNTLAYSTLIPPGVTSLTFTPGAVVSGGTITINGTPVVGGTLTLPVASSYSITSTRGGVSLSYTLTTQSCPAITLSGSSPSASQGEAVSVQMSQSGGVGSITYSLVSGELPPGITLSSSGLLSGSSLVSGVFPITVKATDSRLCTGTLALTVTIHGPRIRLEQDASPIGVDGTPVVVFSNQAVKSTSALKTMTIRNQGDVPLQLGTLALTGDTAQFAVSAPASTQIAPGGSTTFTVSYSPTVAAVHTLSIRIPSNDAFTPLALINISATGKDVRLADFFVVDGRTQAGQSLSPAFSPDGYNYTLAAPLERLTPTVKLYVRPVDSGATVTINGQAAVTGLFNTVQLPLGRNTFTIVSSLGTATRTYTLVVIRQPPPYRPRLAVEAPSGTALTPATSVVAWGWNAYGQTTVPGGLTGVKSIAAGGYHNLALKMDGSVVGWGSDFHGQSTVPRGLTGVRSIAAGCMHSLLVRADATISAWGWNSYGQTSTPIGLTDGELLSGGYAHTLALDGAGAVRAWGDNSYGQCSIPEGLSDVLAVSAGGAHSVAIQGDSTVIAWGYAGDGATSIPAGLGQVKAIAAGDAHTLALKVTGTVAAWGRSSDGQTAVPAGLTEVVALAAGFQHNLALRRDGSVVAWGGYNAYGETTAPAGLKNVIAIGAGDYHSLALVRAIPEVSLGSQTAGSPAASKTFVLRSTGVSDLVLGTPTVEGPHAADFALTGPGLSTLVAGSSTTLGIVFTPGAAGLRTATLRIPSNDGTDFLIALSGTGVEAPPAPYPAWQQQHFGGTAGARTASGEDFDGDGVANLLEFAFGTDPTLVCAGPLCHQGGVITPGLPHMEGTSAVFVRRKDRAAAGIAYTVEFSPDLSTWTAATATPTVLADDGTNEVVSIPMPTAQPRHFFRVRVSATP